MRRSARGGGLERAIFRMTEFLDDPLDNDAKLVKFYGLAWSKTLIPYLYVLTHIFLKD
jgi:hypothetical protein